MSRRRIIDGAQLWRTEDETAVNGPDLRKGDVAGARSRIEPLVAGHLHLNRAIRAVERLVQRRVSEGVLIANLMRDVERDVVNLVDRLRVVRDATRSLRQVVERRARRFRLVRVREESNRV